MIKESNNSEVPQGKKTEIPGDPVYGADEDIYNRGKKEALNADEGAPAIEGLDVPGSELDDADEMIGEEDEENNYYSIGGDDHNDLDEDA